MPAGRRSWFVAAAVLVGSIASLAVSQDVDPAKQREEQKKIKQRIDEASRRLGSTLDAMAYQRLSTNTERQMLEGVAKDLRGLSEKEIKEILDRYEAAIAATDPATATAAQKEALARQRKVVEQLRGMFFKLDVIRSLDEAATRLERAAESQLVINSRTQENARIPRTPPARRGGGVALDFSEERALEQTDLRDEVKAIFGQISNLLADPLVAKTLTQEQKDRLAAANVMARGTALAEAMEYTARTLRERAFSEAATQQRRHAKELQDLAAALRNPPSNRLDALKAAAEKLDRAIDAQTKVNNDTAEPINPEDAAKSRREGQDPKIVRGNQVGDQQTKAEFATRAARKASEQAAPEVADMLKPVENNQWKAEDALREGKLDDAQNPQEKALTDLKATKAELDRQIAAAELAKKDPLAAVKQAAERVEQLIKDQKDANAKTEKAEANPAKLPAAKVAQKDVAKGTDEVRNMPLPPNQVAKDALNKAAEAMKAANEKLDAKAPTEAKPNQQEALKNLEEAKAALEQQAKNIEQRREDIAKLEELKNKLEELAKNEKELAKDANKADNDPKKPDTGDLGKKQDDLVPPTKDAGQQLKDMANQNKNTDPKAAEKLNEAANKVADANMKQDGAKNDLNMNMPKAGGEKAMEAANKLQQAAKDVQDQIDQKKGQEANDQAALQPNNVDPMNAADQIQKAIDHANMAAQKSNEANMALNPMDKGMMQPTQQQNLAELQKQIAKQAADQKLPDAAKSADQAAKALDKGDLPQAIQNQQKALEQLNKAGQQPMGGMPMDKNAMPMGGMPMDKNGMPMGGMPMGGMPMGGMMGQNPGQLSQQQQQVLDATRALQQSQQSNNAAQSAIQQAQANAPGAVQGQLQQAQNQLQQAQNQLQQGQPGQAGMNQQGAAQSLQQALNALQAAQQQGMGMGMGMGMMGMGMGMGMGQGMGMGMGMGMGQGMGMGMGQGMGMGMGMGMGQQGMGKGSNAQQGMNQGMSEGDMQGGEKLKNAGSGGTAATGDGKFINLRNKERDKVQQGSDTQFPAEFRELIKQYNVNIKNAKPATPAPNGK